MRWPTEVEGTLKASEISVDRVEDVRTVLKPGEEVSRSRSSTSIARTVVSACPSRPRSSDEERANLREHRDRESDRRRGPTTLGDLIKRQMDKNAERE